MVTKKGLFNKLCQTRTIFFVNCRLFTYIFRLYFYSGGLRISELINLKAKDIDSDRMQIRIEQSKEIKNRYILLSKKTLLFLRQYFKEFKPKEWLFVGENDGQFADRTIQNTLKNAVQRVRQCHRGYVI